MRAITHWLLRRRRRTFPCPQRQHKPRHRPPTVLYVDQSEHQEVPWASCGFRSLVRGRIVQIPDLLWCFRRPCCTGNAGSVWCEVHPHYPFLGRLSSANKCGEAMGSGSSGLRHDHRFGSWTRPPTLPAKSRPSGTTCGLRSRADRGLAFARSRL